MGLCFHLPFLVLSPSRGRASEGLRHHIRCPKGVARSEKEDEIRGRERCICVRGRGHSTAKEKGSHSKMNHDRGAINLPALSIIGALSLSLSLLHSPRSPLEGKVLGGHEKKSSRHPGDCRVVERS
jgi:hypothetical protein